MWQARQIWLRLGSLWQGLLWWGAVWQACLGLSERGSVWLCKVGYGRRVVVGFGTARSVEARLGVVRLVMVWQARCC